MRTEKTLVILKPDAVNRNLVGRIIQRFEEKGLKLAALKMVFLDKDKIETHYKHHKGKSFFNGIVNFMISAPAVLIVLEGKDAVNVVRSMSGPTNGRVATAGTIRGDFGMSGGQNIIHSSDSIDAAKEEIERFFNKEDILKYERADLNHIYAEDERVLKD